MADGPGSPPGSLRPGYPVRTERLLLRPLAMADADALLAYRGRDDVSRYVPFEPMSRDDIVARIDERNEPSLRLARRLGMRQEARLVRNERFKGEWSTEVDFAMLAEEWYGLTRR